MYFFEVPFLLIFICFFSRLVADDRNCTKADPVSPDGFGKLGITGEDMYDYPMNFGIMEYTCGTGLKDWNKIINCTTKNAAAINDANTKCEEIFETTNQTCQDEITFLKCTYVLLKNYCGQDAWNFACYADTNGVRYSTPNCIKTMINCDAISTTIFPELDNSSTMDYSEFTTTIITTCPVTSSSHIALFNGIHYIIFVLLFYVNMSFTWL